MKIPFAVYKNKDLISPIWISDPNQDKQEVSATAPCSHGCTTYMLLFFDIPINFFILDHHTMSTVKSYDAVSVSWYYIYQDYEDY